MEFNNALVLYTLYKNIFFDSCVMAKVVNPEVFTEEEYLSIAVKVSKALSQTYESMTQYGQWQTDFKLEESTLTPITSNLLSAYRAKITDVILKHIQDSNRHTEIKDNFIGMPLGYMKMYDEPGDPIKEDVVNSCNTVTSILIAYLNDLHTCITDSLNFRLYYFFKVLNKCVNSEIIDMKFYEQKVIFYNEAVENINHFILGSFDEIKSKYEKYFRKEFNFYDEVEVLDYNKVAGDSYLMECKEDYIKMVTRLALTNVNDESALRNLVNLVDIFRESIGKPVEEDQNIN